MARTAAIRRRKINCLGQAWWDAAIGSLAKVYGGLTFIPEHPEEIDAYLQEQQQRYEQFKAEHPVPPDVHERFERGRRELLVRPS